jgi:MbtH protein
MELTMNGADDLQEDYTVLLNEEEQYSLWPLSQEIPAGWRSAGKQGSREDCFRYVDEVWTDMRPLSLRKRMTEQGTS